MKGQARTGGRQIFVLTPEETRTLCFVLVAFGLGLAAKHYRQNHSSPMVKTAIVETANTTSLPAQKRAEAKLRSRRSNFPKDSGR